MVWTLRENDRRKMAKENSRLFAARQEKKRKTNKIVENSLNEGILVRLSFVETVDVKRENFLTNFPERKDFSALSFIFYTHILNVEGRNTQLFSAFNPHQIITKSFLLWMMIGPNSMILLIYFNFSRILPCKMLFKSLGMSTPNWKVSSSF